MKFNYVEAVGIFAAILVLIGMCLNTNTFKGNVYMRSLNLIGCIAYVIYGIALKGVSLVALNGILVFVHAFYLYKAYKMSEGGIKAFKERQKEQLKHIKEYNKKHKKIAK